MRKARCDLDDEFEETYFIIPAEKKESIRDELDFLNINEATLFPELEHQLVYLQNRKLPNPGEVEIYEDFSRKTISHTDNSSSTEESVAPHAEPHPDVHFVVNKYLTEVPDLAEKVALILEKGTSEIDWWLKDSTVSRINRDITRTLQAKMSMQESKILANNIVKEILIPLK